MQPPQGGVPPPPQPPPTGGPPPYAPPAHGYTGPGFYGQGGAPPPPPPPPDQPGFMMAPMMGVRTSRRLRRQRASAKRRVFNTANMANTSAGADLQLLSPVVVLRRLSSNAVCCRLDKDDRSPPSPAFDFPGFDIADLKRNHKRTAQSTELPVHGQEGLELDSNAVSINEESLEVANTYASREEVDGMLDAEREYPVPRKESSEPLELPTVRIKPSPLPGSSRRETRPRGAALQTGARTSRRLRRQRASAKRRVFNIANMANTSAGADLQLLSPVVVLRRLSSNAGCCRLDKDDRSPPSPPFDFPGCDIADMKRNHKHTAQNKELPVHGQEGFELDSNVVSINGESLEAANTCESLEEVDGMFEPEREYPAPRKELSEPLELPTVKRKPSSSPGSSRRETRPRGAALQTGARRSRKLRRLHAPVKRRMLDKTNMANTSAGADLQLISPVVVLRRLSPNAVCCTLDENDDGSPPSPPFDIPGSDIADLKRNHKHTAQSKELPVHGQEGFELDSNLVSINGESLEGMNTCASREEVDGRLEPERGYPAPRKEPPGPLLPTVTRKPSPSPGSSRSETRPRGAALQTGDVLARCDLCGEKCLGKSGLDRHAEHCRVGVVKNNRIKSEWRQNPTDQRRHTDTVEQYLCCDLCGKTFCQKSSLTRHLLSHTGQRRHSCNLCGKAFTHKGGLTQHAKNNMEQKSHSCEACGKVFAHICRLVMHRQTHKGQKPYICDICGIAFRQKCQLTQHRLSHTSQTPHNCEVCHKAFRHKASLTNHLLSHTGQKPHSCNVCGKAFRQKGQLTQHLLTHSGQKPHSCDVCGKVFRVTSHLTLHLLIHTGQKPHRCGVCGKVFRQKGAMAQHLLTHTGQKPHCCGVCGRAFRRKDTMTQHLLTHAGQKEHSCDVCGRKFFRKTNMTRHLLTHTGQKEHSCDLCGKAFARKGYLAFHFLTHTRQKSYSCDICGKVLGWKSSLIKHRRAHTGQKPFTCDVCGRAFGGKSMLARHLLCHTGQKPHSCDICHKKFTRKSTIATHLLTHTG